MKVNLFLLMMMITGLAKAQITINQNDLGSAGDMVVIANDTNCAVPWGAAGVNQIWNLGAIQNEYTDTVWFMLPAGTPGAAIFPASNLVQKMNDGNGDYGYVYLYNTATYSEMLGTYNAGIVFKATPALRQITFPSTYNTTFNGNTSYEARIATPFPPYDSTKIILNLTYNSLIDAWGTVTTPLGNNPALRQKMIIHQEDSTFMHNALTNTWEWDMNVQAPQDDTSFVWLGNAMKYRLASMALPSALSPVTRAEYLLYAAATGISKVSQTEGIKIYPNPVSDAFTLVTTAAMHNAHVSIYNSIGQEVKHMSNINGTSVHISRSGLPAGIYYIDVTDEKHTSVKGKLLITD